MTSTFYYCSGVIPFRLSDRMLTVLITTVENMGHCFTCLKFEMGLCISEPRCTAWKYIWPSGLSEITCGSSGKEHFCIIIPAATHSDLIKSDQDLAMVTHRFGYWLPTLVTVVHSTWEVPGVVIDAKCSSQIWAER